MIVRQFFEIAFYYLLIIIYYFKIPVQLFEIPMMYVELIHIHFETFLKMVKHKIMFEVLSSLRYCMRY
jgi:hypothetical protein